MIGVCGSLGSGKSCLISSVLGHLDTLTGGAFVRGSIGYVPQQAWIFEATIRDNITYGMPYEEKKFLKGSTFTPFVLP